MLYNFVADSMHLKNLCCRFLQVKCTFRRKTAILRFWASLKGLGATYAVHLRLIGKRVVDFLLVLIELFASCYGWGTTSKNRLKIGVYEWTGSVWPKISGRGGRPPSTIRLVRKIRMNDLPCGIRMWGTSFFRFVTIHAFDRQTDRIAFAIGLLCVALHAVAR